jgi:hypothetical protein
MPVTGRSRSGTYLLADRDCKRGFGSVFRFGIYQGYRSYATVARQRSPASSDTDLQCRTDGLLRIPKG